MENLEIVDFFLEITVVTPRCPFAEYPAEPLFVAVLVVKALYFVVAEPAVESFSAISIPLQFKAEVAGIEPPWSPPVCMVMEVRAFLVIMRGVFRALFCLEIRQI